MNKPIEKSILPNILNSNNIGGISLTIKYELITAHSPFPGKKNIFYSYFTVFALLKSDSTKNSSNFGKSILF